MAATPAAASRRARATRWREDCCPDAAAIGDRRRRRAPGLSRDGRRRPATSPSLIDHTLLKPDATRQEIEKLCREAAEHRIRDGVRQSGLGRDCAARLLRGTPVGVCTVVGFPLGATVADVKHFETQRVIFDGAREVDMVINIGALKSGDLRTVERDIEAVTAPCRARRAS